MSITFTKKQIISLLLVTLVTGCASIQLPELPRTSANGNHGVDPTELSLSQRLIDKGIEQTAKINIYNQHPELKKTSRIALDSFDGRVLITGEVDNEIDKKEIQDLVSSLPEVKVLYNQLKVSRKHTLSYSAHDAYITTMFMGKMIADTTLNASHFKIVTESGVVYVLGRATQVEKNALVQLARTTPEVMELVLLVDLYK